MSFYDLAIDSFRSATRRAPTCYVITAWLNCLQDEEFTSTKIMYTDENIEKNLILLRVKR